MIDIEDFKKSIGKKSRLLGIDPGKNRIGLAISDEDKLVSTPLKTISKKNNSKHLFEEISKLIENKKYLKTIQLSNFKNVKHTPELNIKKLDNLRINFSSLNQLNNKRFKIIHIANFGQKLNHQNIFTFFKNIFTKKIKNELISSWNSRFR